MYFIFSFERGIGLLPALVTFPGHAQLFLLLLLLLLLSLLLLLLLSSSSSIKVI